MLHLGAVDTVDSDSDEERITYAASEHDCSERGSDSGPSVLEELPCEIRGSPGRDMAHQVRWSQIKEASSKENSRPSWTNVALIIGSTAPTMLRQMDSLSAPIRH
ncbi:TPA: hypothetical protein ACH3X2_002639 [Trebouxia sp. C0005]